MPESADPAMAPASSNARESLPAPSPENATPPARVPQRIRWLGVVFIPSALTSVRGKGERRAGYGGDGERKWWRGREGACYG